MPNQEARHERQEDIIVALPSRHALPDTVYIFAATPLFVSGGLFSVGFLRTLEGFVAFLLGMVLTTLLGGGIYLDTLFLHLLGGVVAPG